VENYERQLLKVAGSKGPVTPQSLQAADRELLGDRDTPRSFIAVSPQTWDAAAALGALGGGADALFGGAHPLAPGTLAASPLGSCARYRRGVVDRPWVREDVRNGLPTAPVRALGGCVMAEFVRFTLDDGSEVLFESAESDLVALHGGPPDVRDGGKLTARLQGVAEAAEEVAGSLRARLVPDEVSLEFGLKVSGGVNWFFAKAQAEGTIKVTVKWAGNSAPAAPPGTGQDPEKG
jgi:hypothetical protein